MSRTKFATRFTTLWAVAAFAALALPLRAYDIIRGPGGARVTWSDGAIPIVIRMSTAPTLEGGRNFAGSVSEAALSWNGAMQRVQFATQIAAPGSAGRANGINEAAFDSAIYSNEEGAEGFGANTLAVTISYRSEAPRADGSYARTEADVLFNTAYVWDVYSYELRNSPIDIRRVAIHEFGHVLGLDHPDETGQSVTAIMNSRVSNVSSQYSDDIEGAQFLYGKPGGYGHVNYDKFAEASTLVLWGNQHGNTGSTIGATTEPGEPDHLPGDRSGASIWWKWTPSTNGTLTVDTAGSKFDTALAAYTGSALDALTQVASNDDVESGVVRTSRISFAVQAGVTYHIALAGWDGEWGRFSIFFQFVSSPPGMPTVYLSRGGIDYYQTVDANVAGSPAPSVRWQMLLPNQSIWTDLADDDLVSGATTTSLRIARVVQFVGAQVRCIASNSVGSTVSAPVSLVYGTFGPNMVGWAGITAPQNPFTGSTATFAVKLINLGDTAWTEGTKLSLRRSGELAIVASQSIAGVQPGAVVTINLPFTVPYVPGFYSYRMDVETPTGWRNAPYSLSITAVGENVAPRIAVPPASRSAVVGENVTLQVIAVGATPFSYQWFFNGSPITGATADKLVLPAMQAAAAGEYRVRVTNSLGYVDSSVAVVQVVLASAPTSLSGNDEATLFVRGDGSRWGIGSDHQGAIGSGTAQSFRQPTRVGENTVAVVGGYELQAFLTRDGELFGSGDSRYGQLGDGGGSERRLAPVPVTNGTDVVYVDAGLHTLFFIRGDGTLWSTGINSYGQLGDGTRTTRMTPVQVAGDVAQVAAADNHTLFLKSDGSVWGMGYSSYLGPGLDVDSSATNLPAKLADGAVAVATSDIASLYLKADGTLWRVGSPHQQVAASVRRVFGGGRVYLFIKEDGTLWGAGSNNYGQLGDGTTTTRTEPILIAQDVVLAGAAHTHSLFVKSDGSLWGMGENSEFRLGEPTTSTRAPVKLAEGGFALPPPPATLSVSNGTHAGKVALRWSPSAHAYGYQVWRRANGGADEIVATVYDRLVHIDDTAVENTAYEYFVRAFSPAGVSSPSAALPGLSRPSVAPQITSHPTDANYHLSTPTVRVTFSVEVSADPEPTYRWQRRIGNGAWTNLSQLTHPTATSRTLDIGGYLSASQDGYQYRCVVTNRAGSVESNSARLRIIGPPPVILQQATAVTALFGQPLRLPVSYSSQVSATVEYLKDGQSIGASFNVSSASASDAGVYVLKVTNSGGTVYSEPITAKVISPPTVTQVSAGDTHSLFITSEGTLWGMGRNGFGQLGLVDYWPYQRFVASSVVSAAAGYEFSIWVDTSGKVWAMGRNDFGQLGVDPYTLTESRVPVFITDGAIAVAAAYYHALILKKDGSLWGVGRNLSGQLGTGTTSLRSPLVRIAGRVRAMSTAYVSSVYLDFNDQLWGMGSAGAFGLNPETTTHLLTPTVLDGNVARATAGNSSTLYVKNNGSVWGVGLNSYGQLGAQVAIGARTTAPVPIAVNAQNAWVQEAHSLVLLGDGTLRTMGSNRVGQLGVGGGTRTELTVALNDVTAAAAGTEHSLAIDASGHLWGFGRNTGYELGLKNMPAWTATPTKLLDGTGTAPRNPPRVSADGTLGDGILLTWDAQLGATYYEVWRSTSPDFHDAVLHASSIQHPLFADLWSSPGVDYYYRIRSRSTAPAGSFGVSVRGRHGDVFASPTLASQPQSQSVSARSNVSLSVGAPTPGSTYQWRRNGVGVAGATASTLQLADIGDDQAGAYTVTVTTASGTVVSDSALVEVTKLPQTIETFTLASRTALASVPLLAQASSSLPVHFEVVDGPGMIEVDVLHLSPGASVTVRATQPGNRHYLPATAVTRVITREASFAAAWHGAHFTVAESQDPALAAWSADPDADGLSNLLEYALGLDPRSGDRAEVGAVSQTAGEWIFTYCRPRDRADVVYAVEISSDLLGWSTANVTLHLESSADGFEVWRAAHPQTDAPLFFRLKVTLQ